MANKPLIVHAANDVGPVAHGNDNEVIDEATEPQFYPVNESEPVDIPVALRFEDDFVNYVDTPNEVMLERNYSNESSPAFFTPGTSETGQSQAQWVLNSDSDYAPAVGSFSHYSEIGSSNGCRNVSPTLNVFQPRSIVNDPTKDASVEIMVEEKLTNVAGASTNEEENLLELNTSSESIEVLPDPEMSNFVNEVNSPLLGDLPRPVRERTEQGRPANVEWPGQESCKGLKIAIIVIITAMLCLLGMVLSMDGFLPRVFFGVFTALVLTLAMLCFTVICYV